MPNPSTLTDTPYKSATSITQTRKKMLIDEVKADVERDIKDTLYTVDTNEFLKNIIPKTPDWRQSLQKLKNQDQYEGYRWANFPKTPPDEKSLYGPLAEALNAIVAIVPEELVQTNIVYVDRHNRTPKSLEKEMAAARPDGAGAQLDANLPVVDDDVDGQLDELSSGKLDSPAEHTEAKKKLLWWMSIHIVYEIKVDKSDTERFEAVMQLLTYMRQVLMEQLDRRFVLGFVLLFDELTLVLCDRSGVMVAEKAINIHTEAKKFIQIIMGFSCMTPVQLGWDPAMEIYHPRTKDIQPSYKIAHNFEGVKGKGRYNIHWVIDVVQDGKVEKYVTVAIISAVRSAELCGRATVVYEVVKFDEKENPKKTYALKRYWRPIRTDSNPELYPSEGQIYDILDKDKADEMKHAIVCHDIKIDHEVDSTFKLISRNKVVTIYKRPVKPLLPQKRKEIDADAELRLEVRGEVSHSDPARPVERYHTNVLMPMGEVIKMFSCRLELLKCFRDYVEEHKDCHKRLILHRDISSGNLLIFEADDGSTFGRLMDFDHAKKASGMRKIESKVAGLSPLELDKRRDNVRRLVQRKVDDNVVDIALKWLDKEVSAIAYIDEAAESTDPSKENSGKTLCPTDLGWANTDATKPHEWPDFSERTPSPGERTGTIPFMSAEVIARESLFELHGKTKLPTFTHQAIHDIESLIWVLIYLCITRKGPGLQMRRNELDNTSPDYDEELEKVVLNLFEGNASQVKETKFSLARNPDLIAFEKQVVAYFHPYFEPLKPYVCQWWAILLLGYRYRGEEFYNIHDHIIRLLDKAITKIGQDVTEDGQAQLESRKKYKEKRLAIFRDSTTPQSASILVEHTAAPGPSQIVQG
ncbi:hypothetical protein C0992_003728 [Termitomyces sp. T32_za158]|nr:hypothetical protein C0992_003728 [Termitomyces sp. T32_za158]